MKKAINLEESGEFIQKNQDLTKDKNTELDISFNSEKLVDNNKGNLKQTNIDSQDNSIYETCQDLEKLEKFFGNFQRRKQKSVTVSYNQNLSHMLNLNTSKIEISSASKKSNLLIYSQQ